MHGQSPKKRRNEAMKRTLLKALVMLEKWENSWFLNGGFHESIDGQLIDVKALRVNMQDFDGTLRMAVKQAPDVLLLESTLTPHFVSRMAIQVRNKLPNLPIWLQRTLLQMALRDDLTGLHNRRGFMALAAQNLRWARDARQNMLMFFADLDGLKWIN